MVNMYSMGMMGSMGNITGAMNSQNVPQYFHQRYGNGYADMNPNGRPYIQGYPMGITPPPANLASQKSFIAKLIDKLF